MASVAGRINRPEKPRFESANVKALRDLRQGMVNNAKFGKMVSYSVECMGKMAVDQVSVEEICESGCIAASLDACTLNKKNDTLQHQTNKAILRAGIDPHCIVKVSEAVNGNFTPFKNSIETHSNPESLKSSSDVISMLCGADPPEGPKNIERLHSQGVFTAISARMADPTLTDASVLTSLSTTLALGANRAEVARSVLENGVLEKLLETLAKNPHNHELATSIAKLVGQASSASDELKQTIREMGLVDQLSKFMQTFHGNHDVKDAIKGAMTEMTTQHDIEPLMAILRDTSKVDPSTGSALSEEQLLQQRLEATRHLAAITLVNTNQAFFKAGQGVSEAVQAYSVAITQLEQHVTGQHVTGQHVTGQHPTLIPSVLLDTVTQSAILLANISSGGEHQIYHVMKHTGVDALINGIVTIQSALDQATQHGDHQTKGMLLEGLSTAIAAMAAMVTRPENVQYIDKSGGFLAPIEAAQPYLQYPSVFNPLVDLIDRALANPQYLSDETKRAMLDTLLDAVQRGIIPDDPRVAEQLTRALCILAADEQLENEILNAGGAKYLLDVLSKHKSDPDTVLSTLNAIELATMTDTGCEQLIRLGAENILRDLLEEYKDNPEICELIHNILSQLQDYKENGGSSSSSSSSAVHTSSVHRTGFGDLSVSEHDQAYTSYGDDDDGDHGEVVNGVGGTRHRRGASNLQVEDEIIGASGMRRTRVKGLNALAIDEGADAGVDDDTMDVLAQLRKFGLGAGLDPSQFGKTPHTMSQQQQQQQQHHQQQMHMMGQHHQHPQAHQQPQQPYPDQYQGGDSVITTTTKTIMLDGTPQSDEDIMAQHALHLVETLNQVQLFITERRGAKLLGLFEVLFMQQQSYDRDYLLNAVLDGIASICEEGFLAEEQFVENGQYLTPDIAPLLNPLGYSHVLNEFEQGLIENHVADRLCQRILLADDQDELDIAVLTDNLATLFSLITRDVISLVHVKFGIKPQYNPNVETDEVPYQSSNPHLSSAARKYAVQNAMDALEDAYQDLLDQRENERIQLAQQRQLEVERMKQLTQVTISKENELVLQRIQQAKREAEEKAKRIKEEMAERLEKARLEQEQKILEMNRMAELRREKQLQEILRAAKTATIAKIEFEQTLAEGGSGSGRPGQHGVRTRDEIKRRMEESKTFLIAGSLLTKHSDFTGPSSRHLYVTQNMEYIVYRNAGTNEIKKSQMMKIVKFQGVKQGRHTEALRLLRRDDEAEADEYRKKLKEQGYKISELELLPTSYAFSPFFVIYGVDNTGKEREVAFECDTIDLARRWVNTLERLHDYAKTLNEFQDDTMVMQSNPLHNITQAEKGLEKFMSKERENDERFKRQRKLLYGDDDDDDSVSYSNDE